MPSLSMGPVQRRTTPGWQMFHWYDITQDAFQVHVRLVDYQGKTWTVKPFEFTDQPVPGGSVSPLGDATVADVNGFLQAAIDLAWEIGLRPAGYSDPATELTAVRYHLEDMRKLAKVK